MSNSAQSAFDVAIIGGGYCGVLVAVQLIRQHAAGGAPYPLNIHVVKGAERLARGAAYGTECPLHLLNVPAEGMSALADDKDHFFTWLQELNPAVSPHVLVSRGLYGDYIEELFRATLDGKPENVTLNIIEEKAQAVSPIDNGKRAQLSFQSGRALKADKVVLALGNFLPNESALATLGQQVPERVHVDPWSPRTVEAVDPKETVLLIGSGLTMVDVALQLHSRQHEGRIIAISRHGYLPHAQRFFHRLENVPTFEELFPGGLPSRVLDLYRLVRKASQQAADWRHVFNALRPHVQTIWRSFNSAERRRFLRHVRALWEVHRHRLAPDVLKEIEALRYAGKICLIAGSIVELEPADDCIEVTFKPRASKTNVGVTVNHVINCTGPSLDLRNSSHPLIKSMREQGLIRPDGLGLGLDIADDGAVIANNGTPSTLFFALGSLLKGTLWETTAVPELRVQARSVAATVLQSKEAPFVPAPTHTSVETPPL